MPPMFAEDRAEPTPAGSEGKRSTDLWTNTRAHELSWWFLCLFVATGIAKLAALDLIYARNLGSAVDEIIQSRSLEVARPVVVALLLARDVLQCALLAAVVFAITWRATARVRRLVVSLSLLFLLLVLGGNHVSFKELGTYATSNTLVTAWTWVRHQPASLNAYLSHSTALSLAIIISLTFAPAQLARLTSALARPRLRSLPFFGAGLVALGLVLWPLGAWRFGKRAFPVHGHWAGILSAALGPDTTSPAGLTIPSERELMAEYRDLVAPRRSAPRPPPAPPLDAPFGPRHVLVVGLETAPRELYPLTTDPTLPTFHRMTKRAIVSEHHYTTSPYTRIANFSILSGLYAPQAGLPSRFGKVAGDGFAAVLRRHGYETSYVDSWVLDWLPGSGERVQAQMLGFDTVLDSDVRRDDGVYEVLVRAEEVAFDRAFERIHVAQQHGHKAAIFLGTMLGHAPWVAKKGDEHLDARAKVHKLALLLDGLFARLLERLDEVDLSEEVLIVVVGDHGLRLTDEFRSLGLDYEHSDLAYNVPFLLYAPGLVRTTRRVPYATSHVDITPTLLHLLGIPAEAYLHHGSYVLEPALRDRVVFLPSSRLGPLDGLTYQGKYVTQHALSGVTQLGRGNERSSMHALTRGEAQALPEPLRDPATLLEGFDRHTLRIAGALLRRAQSH